MQGDSAKARKKYQDLLVRYLLTGALPMGFSPDACARRYTLPSPVLTDGASANRKFSERME